MEIRQATCDDAEGMSIVLAGIIAAWGSERPSDIGHVQQFYIGHPDRVQCTVAVDDDGALVGFQSLKRVSEGNIYGVAPGWGVIGTYVSLDAPRRGIGSALFVATARAARQAGLEKIDATIGENNMGALSYYDSMGFRTYRTKPGSVSKCYDVPKNVR